MEARVIDIIPKIAQWESIEYAPDFVCPECGKSGLQGAVNGNIEKPNLVGWCETNNGYMAVFECPLCGKKYRWHPHVTIFDLDQFDFCLGAHYIGKNEWCKVKNGEELDKKLTELHEQLKNKCK